MRGLLRASGRAFAVRVFAENFSAHFGEFPHNFRNLCWRSRNVFGKFPAKISAKFPQFLEVQFAVRGGGSLCAAKLCYTQLQRAD